MKQRCYNPKNCNYQRYGARGIGVCDEWNASFHAFEAWAYANGYKKGLSLDRYPDNNGNYEPSNCRWTTQKEQCRNKRTSVVLTAFGETKTAIEWSEDSRCVVPYPCLLERIKNSIGHEAAITTPTIDVGTRGLGWDRLGYRDSARITAFGETKTYMQWEKDPRCVIGRSSLRERINKGMPPERAITTLPQKWNRWDKQLHVST